MDLFKNLFVMAILVESVVEIFKMVYDDGKFNPDNIFSIVVGLMLAFTVQLDLLDMLGIVTTNKVVGIILTGLLISRGGNFIHDLIDRIGGNNLD